MLVSDWNPKNVVLINLDHPNFRGEHFGAISELEMTDNLLNLKRTIWAGTAIERQASTPSSSTSSRMVRLGKGGTGVLSVDDREVARKSMEHSTAVTFPEDERFDICMDTRSGVAMLEYRYDPPFRFTFKLVPEVKAVAESREELALRKHRSPTRSKKRNSSILPVGQTAMTHMHRLLNDCCGTNRPLSALRANHKTFVSVHDPLRTIEPLIAIVLARGMR